MATEGRTVRIAVNVMRARLTIVGFNLAIVTFQLNAVRNFAGGVEVAGFGEVVHLSADVALLIALALSVAAMVLFIAAGALDSVGVVDHPAVIVGDVCMYLALAQSIAGFFTPVVATLREVLVAIAAPDGPANVLVTAIVFTGGVGWVLAFYVGPVVSLLRSPFAVTANRVLIAIYLVLVGSIAGVNALASSLEADAAPDWAILLLTLAHPVRW